jgi:hypothetical protein
MLVDCAIRKDSWNWEAMIFFRWIKSRTENVEEISYEDIPHFEEELLVRKGISQQKTIYGGRERL